MTRIGTKARAILTGITLVACLGAGQAVTSSRPAHVAWSLAWHASLPYSNSLVSVTSTGTGDIWAVGLGVGHHGSYAVRWNGRRWRVLRFPDPGFVAGAVSASSPDNVWVTGSTPQNPELAYRWDGRAWRQLTMPVSVGADNPLVVLSLTDVWITGGYGIVPGHGRESMLWNWNGVSWKSYALPVGLYGSDSIAGSSARNLWVAGKAVLAWSRPARLVVYRWSGSSWRREPIPRERITWLPGLSVSSSGDVWVEATSPRMRDRHHLAIVLHRHGRRWASLPGIDAQGIVDWPPTADGRDHVWFGNTEYWNGAILLGPDPVGPRYCAGGIYSPNLVDMHGVPGRYRTLWAAACSRRLNGRLQGVILASKVW